MWEVAHNSRHRVSDTTIIAADLQRKRTLGVHSMKDCGWGSSSRLLEDGLVSQWLV